MYILHLALKIEKLRYLQNRLANFDEILHDDTYYSSLEIDYRLFKFKKNPR